MTRDMIGHHDNHELAFETLCAGIDQVKLLYVSRIWTSLTWLKLVNVRLDLISTNASKSDARFKSGQN